MTIAYSSLAHRLQKERHTNLQTKDRPLLTLDRFELHHLDKEK